MATILTFGDSVTYGAWDNEGGWADRLKRYLNSQITTDPSYASLLYNLGISGETTTSLLYRLKNEIAMRPDPEQELVTIIAYGMNDSLYVPSQDQYVVPLNTFKANLYKAVATAKPASYHVILLTINPVREDITSQYVIDDKVRNNKVIVQYNQAITEVATANKVTLIDISQELYRMPLETVISDDGIHPNATGHQLIFTFVRDALNQLEVL